MLSQITALIPSRAVPKEKPKWPTLDHWMKAGKVQDKLRSVVPGGPGSSAYLEQRWSKGRGNNRHIFRLVMKIFKVSGNATNDQSVLLKTEITWTSHFSWKLTNRIRFSYSINELNVPLTPCLPVDVCLQHEIGVRMVKDRDGVGKLIELSPLKTSECLLIWHDANSFSYLQYCV